MTEPTPEQINELYEAKQAFDLAKANYEELRACFITLPPGSYFSDQVTVILKETEIRSLDKAISKQLKDDHPEWYSVTRSTRLTLKVEDV